MIAVGRLRAEDPVTKWSRAGRSGERDKLADEVHALTGSELEIRRILRRSKEAKARPRCALGARLHGILHVDVADRALTVVVVVVDRDDDDALGLDDLPILDAGRRGGLRGDRVAEDLRVLRQVVEIAAARRTGTARTASVFGEKAEISSPSIAKVSAWASDVATSCGVAAKVAGINNGWLAMPWE